MTDDYVRNCHSKINYAIKCLNGLKLKTIEPDEIQSIDLAVSALRKQKDICDDSNFLVGQWQEDENIYGEMHEWFDESGTVSDYIITELKEVNEK